MTAEPLLTDNFMFSWRFLHLVWVVFTRFQVHFMHGQAMCLGIFISFYLFKIVGIPVIVASLLYDKWDCLSHNGVVHSTSRVAHESHEREREREEEKERMAHETKFAVAKWAAFIE